MRVETKTVKCRLTMENRPISSSVLVTCTSDGELSCRADKFYFEVDSNTIYKLLSRVKPKEKK